MKQHLTHWTNEKFKEDMINGKLKFRPIPLDMKEKVGNMKPLGFWLSVNESWEKWLDGNWDSWTNGKVCLNVELNENINVFVIKSKEQFLDEFKRLTGKEYSNLNMIGQFSLQDFHKKLKDKYDGMWLLSEPFWKHRTDDDFMYFYAWDCESICVWNKEKIKFFEVEK